MESHTRTTADNDPDAVACDPALRAMLARQYGHLAIFMSRAAFDQVIDDLTSLRLRTDLVPSVAFAAGAFV